MDIKEWRIITAADTIHPTDEGILFNSSSPASVVLHSPKGYRRAHFLVNLTANDITITMADSGSTINGGASYVLAATASGAILLSDNISKWFVVAGYLESEGEAIWGSISGTLANQTDLNTALGLKAALAGPTFTGVPAAPTAAANTTTTQLATTAYVGILRSHLDATVTYNNVDTLAATALSVTVEASKKYAIEVVIHSTSAVKGLLLDFGGTATLTSSRGQWTAMKTDGSAFGGAAVSDLTTDFSASALDGVNGMITFRGSVVINAAGTLLIRGAQNVADVSDTTILSGSTMVVTKLT